MRTYVLIATAFVAFLAGCNEDRGTISLTYNKASAVYGNIDNVRATPLFTTPQAIVNPGKIFIGTDFLLVGEKGSGIHVYDNTDPNNPFDVGFIQLPFTNEFYVEKNFIYAESHYDFIKIDLSTINSPVIVDRVEYAFAEAIVNDQNEVLLGFDFEIVTESFKLHSPEAEALNETSMLYYNYQHQLIPASSVPSSFAGNGTSDKGTLNKITIANGHAYVVGDQTLYTFQDDLTDLSYLGTSWLSSGVETIYPENNNLYIGTQNSMIIMDASNPATPQHISEYWHETSCDPVLPRGDIAYLTLRTADFSGCSGDENTLEVIDISNPSSPAMIMEVEMTSPYGMGLIGDYLFVAEGANGLSIFNITDEDNPILVVNHPGVEVFDVMPHPTDPNRVLTTGYAGLEQYSIDFTDMSVSLVSSIAF